MESPRTIKGWAIKYRIGTAIRKAIRMIFTNSHVSQKNLANAGFTIPPLSSGDASGRASGSCSLIHSVYGPAGPLRYALTCKGKERALCQYSALFPYMQWGRTEY